MTTKQHIYADRVVGLRVHNGMVRLDLAVIAGAAKTKDDKPAVKMEITHQIVIPLEAFAAGVKVQQDLLKQVVESRKKGKTKAEPAATQVPSAG